uniref:Putative tail tubular protein n=1 Tax=viral metagenome TaxID=1070528 RepID=A0A6M3X8J7_9ZZZZ
MSIIQWPAISRQPRQKRPENIISYNGFTHGLNTQVPSFQILQTEMSECVNFKLNKGGQLESRRPIVAYTTSPTTSNASVKFFAKVPVGGNNRELLVDSNYLLYYLNSSKVPVNVATLEGDATIVAYNGAGVILDGSYIKQYEDGNITGASKANPCVITCVAHPFINGQRVKITGVAGMTQLNGNIYTVANETDDTFQLSGTDSSAYTTYTSGGIVSSVSLAYDDGTGASGYQFDNRAGTDDTALALGNGTNTRIAYKFTSQTLDTGYLIPPTKITVKLSKQGDGYTGTDNVPITVKIRAVSGDTALITKTLVATAGAVSKTAVEYGAVLTSDDITTHMASATAYYATVEYNNGDGSNYIKVHCTTVASGGVGYYYDGSYNADTTKDPIMSVKPGRPPKGAFGTIHEKRLFIAGDPDNPGYMWYGNLTCLDWSTPDGGGYVGAVDDSRNNYEVGAIRDLFNQLYVIGKETQPYLCILSGASPNDYILSPAFQEVWTTHKTAVNTTNDLWIAGGKGVNSIRGVEQYGDIRTFAESDPVYDRIQDYFSTSTAIAGYYARDGQYWLYMPSYYRILIVNTKGSVPDPLSTNNEMRYPWVEYELYRHVLRSSTYKWTKSGNGTNEYHVELAAGGDPSIATQPDFITMGKAKLVEGAVGSLSNHEWDYGDNDTLGYSTVYVRDDSGDPDTTEVDIRSILGPTCFAWFDDVFYIGGSDGYIYYIDETGYLELSTHQILPRIKTIYNSIPFGYVNLSGLHILGSSLGGSSLTVEIYRNDYQANVGASYTFNFAYYDTLTVNEATMTVSDAWFAIDAGSNPTFRRINLNARSFLISVQDVQLVGHPVYLNALHVRYRQLQI